MRARLVAVLLLVFAVPAFADVAVSVKKGKLVVKGDGTESNVTIDGVGLPAGAVRVTPGGGFTVNGLTTAQVFDGLTDAGAKITLGSGSDVLSLQNLGLDGPITIKTGSGSDVVSVVASGLDRMTIDAGSGLNLVRVCSAGISGDFTVKLGKGSPGIGFNDCPGGGSLAASDGSAVLLESVNFGGAVTVKGAAARHVVALRQSAGATGLTLKNVASAALCYGGVAGPLVLKPRHAFEEGTLIACGGGSITTSAGGRTAVAIADFDFAGLVTKTGDGPDGLSIAGATITGDVVASFGGGDNTLAFESVTITGDLVAKAGKGSDTVDGNDLLVNGDTTFKYGDGANDLAFLVTRFDRDLTVKTGTGDDILDLGGAQIVGTSEIALGKGTNTLTIP